MFAVIGWIVSGLLIGWFARFFYPGIVPMGWFATIALGICGSFLGGLIGNLMRGGSRRLEPAGCLGSIIGAMLIIFMMRHLW